MRKSIWTGLAFLLLHLNVAAAQPAAEAADTDTTMILMAYALYGGSGAATPVQTTIVGTFKGMDACNIAARRSQFTDLSIGSLPGSAKNFMYFGLLCVPSGKR